MSHYERYLTEWNFNPNMTRDEKLRFIELTHNIQVFETIIENNIKQSAVYRANPEQINVLINRFNVILEMSQHLNIIVFEQGEFDRASYNESFNIVNNDFKQLVRKFDEKFAELSRIPIRAAGLSQSKVAPVSEPVENREAEEAAINSAIVKLNKYTDMRIKYIDAEIKRVQKEGDENPYEVQRLQYFRNRLQKIRTLPYFEKRKFAIYRLVAKNRIPYREVEIPPIFSYIQNDFELGGTSIKGRAVDPAEQVSYKSRDPILVVPLEFINNLVNIKNQLYNRFKTLEDDMSYVDMANVDYELTIHFPTLLDSLTSELDETEAEKTIREINDLFEEVNELLNQQIEGFGIKGKGTDDIGVPSLTPTSAPFDINDLYTPQERKIANIVIFTLIGIIAGCCITIVAYPHLERFVVNLFGRRVANRIFPLIEDNIQIIDDGGTASMTEPPESIIDESEIDEFIDDLNSIVVETVSNATRESESSSSSSSSGSTYDTPSLDSTYDTPSPLTLSDVEQEDIEGGSYLSGIDNVNKFKQMKGGSLLDLKSYATTIIKGRNDYPPKMREIIKKYGDAKITKMSACRTPVPSLLTSALNMVSFGSFSKKWEDQPYDKLFHLDLRVVTSQGTILLEKNEVLNASVNPSLSKTTECSEIKVGKEITISQLLEDGKKIQGDKFFKYSAYNNNCQDFIMALLKGSGLGTQENYTFIKQDTKTLFKGLEGTRKFANTITNIGAKVNEIVEGAGAGASTMNEDDGRVNERALERRRAYDFLGDFVENWDAVLESENTTPTSYYNLLHRMDQFVISLRQQANEFRITRLVGLNQATKEHFDANVDYLVDSIHQATQRILNRYAVRESDGQAEAYTFEDAVYALPVNATAELPVVLNPSMVRVVENEDDDSQEARPAEETIAMARQIGSGIKKGENYYIQSIVFDKSKWDLTSAKKWIKDNGYVNKGADDKETQIRFRQVNPKYIEKIGFKRFRTKKIGRNSGISLIISYK